MGNLNIIDQFLKTFSTYIDSGFGLLSPDVAFLTTFLIGIDIVLAGLFWALKGEQNVLGQLIKKVLYVGFFALLINNFAFLTDAIFGSFSQIGLKATGGTMSAADLLRPGKIAATGFTAAHPLLTEAGQLAGVTSFFVNAPTILILLFAWILVVLSFFLLSIQIFITIIEFKLTTLAGFILVPFGLWNKTAFLAERVLGNVIAAGIKVMVLAVIIGIGSTIFGTLASALQTGPIQIEDAMSLLLAALALLGLGIFGPGIASGLISGGPQLGAGAALGTIGGVAAGTAAGVGLATAGARGAASAATGSVRAAASMAGSTSMAYGLSQTASGASGAKGVAVGLAGVASAGVGAFTNSIKDKVRSAFQSGAAGAFAATGGSQSGDGAGPSTSGDVPHWARRMQSHGRVKDASVMTLHAVKDGDRPVSGANPSVTREDE